MTNTQTNRTIMNGIKTMARIGLLAGSLLYNGCSDKITTNRDENYIDQRQALELQQEQKSIKEANARATEEARIERKQGVYIEPKDFVNPEGSIDRYFPIEGAIYYNRASKDYCINAKNYQIFYTDKNTSKLETLITNNPNNCRFHTQIDWDLNPGQVPFLELVNLHDEEGKFFFERTLKVYETHIHLDPHKNPLWAGSYEGGSYYHGRRHKVPGRR